MDPLNLLTYENTDVSWELARQAHAGTSFVPEQRANQECNAYLGAMAHVVETFTPWATDDNLDQLRADLEEYRREYIKRTEAHWRVRAGCVSTMIAGASGFNVARAEKANVREHKSLTALVEWRNKALERLRKTYDPAAQPTAIRSDDDDAIEALRTKLATLEATQKRMKATNKVCRDTKTSLGEKIQALHAMGYNDTQTDTLLHPDFGKPGFAPFQLSNNNANMRRIRERIEALEREAARPETEDRRVLILGEPCTVIENTDETRLQLVFEGNPPAEVRDALKARGFRWAPSQGAWQRLLNDNARAAVNWLTRVEVTK